MTLPPIGDVGDWRSWLIRTFPSYVSAPFAPRHAALWDWLDSIEPAERPHPFVALWPRGGAKSSTAELGVVRIGARRARRYIWYISDTQEKADKHVEAIASMLESRQIERSDPMLAARMLSKYGSSKGWRRSRLRTASHLTVDALGLDVGARGAKVEDQRPDMIILDDVDERTDTVQAVQKKIDTITTTILPSGSNACAVLFIQNLIHPESIASQLADKRAEFLVDRIVSGPFPAIDNFTYMQHGGRFYIQSGEATWAGQDLAVCQSQIDTWGITAFLNEAQHQVEQTGGVWNHIEFQHCDFSAVPVLTRTCVWVDPAVTTTDQSDCMGIQADGRADKIYRLFSWEGIDTPENVIERAILKGIEIGADHVGIETDQGGDTWRSVYSQACNKIRERMTADWTAQGKDTKDMPEIRFPPFASDKAGAGYGSKAERNRQMLSAYERGEIVHVIGTHAVLERALRRFPIKPLDLADAAFWAWNAIKPSRVQIFV